MIVVIEANQRENGKTEQNEKLIAVACKSLIHSHIKTINDLNGNLIE